MVSIQRNMRDILYSVTGNFIAILVIEFISKIALWILPFIK